MKPDSPDSQSCPHCGKVFTIAGTGAHRAMLNFEPRKGGPPRIIPGYVPPETDTAMGITSHLCPSCNEKVIWLDESILTLEEGGYRSEVKSRTLLWPKHAVCKVPDGVLEHLASDFREAHDTLPISPKASAPRLVGDACEAIIQEQEAILDRNLFDQVKKLLALNKVPKYLAGTISTPSATSGTSPPIPRSDQNTGEIVDVDPNEASWTLEVLEGLLAFYFVELPKSAARRSGLNAKLGKAGQKPML